MTDSSPFLYFTSRGLVSYTPARTHVVDPLQIERLPDPPCRPRQRRPHSIHITRFAVGFVPHDLRPQPVTPPKKDSRFRVELRKLATRENAKRVLGSVFAPFSSNNTSSTPSSATDRTRSASTESTRSNRSSWISSSTRSSFAPTSSNRSSLVATSTARSAPVSSVESNSTSLLSQSSASSALPEAVMSRPSISTTSNGNSRPNSISASTLMPRQPHQEADKPVCSGNGVSVSIVLAEPVIFLTGLDHDGSSRDSGSSAILRGKLQLNISKSVKIKGVTLTFTGKARTEWPEGIPPQKVQLFEEDSLRTQVIPFFNALYDGSEFGYGTLCNYSLKNNKSATSSVTNLSLENNSPTHQSGILSSIGSRNRSSTILTARDTKRLSLQSNQSRSFQKGDSIFGPTPQQKGYKIFHPGVYEYSFEIPIDNNCPETTKVPLASVVWQLEALVERAGTFKPNLQGAREIPVIRTPSEESMELVEPISISRKWEDQLHYDIIISGKSFPLGSKIPIAFKLTPLAKVIVHKIKVFVSEGIEYYTNNKKVTRKDVTRKLLLIEKTAGKSLPKEYAGSDLRFLAGGEGSSEGRAQLRAYAQARRDRDAQFRGVPSEPLPEASDNLLGDIDLGLEQNWGQTELEMNVQLPTCEMMEKDRSKRLTHDCTWKNVQVHHWIKIVMRISRVDPADPTGTKRRHFEISIDSPFTILNCRATHANLALPEYTGSNADVMGQQRVCGCPNAAASNISPASSSGSVPTMENFNHPENAGTLPAYPSDAISMTPALARPPQAHLSGYQPPRPIHMLRAPSFNPPAFDDEAPPPPLATPPPLYDHVIGTPSTVDGLADYFSRLGEYEDDHTDDEDMNRVTSRGRVLVPNPRTPGGRIARSFDIPRSNFMFNPLASYNTPRQASRETIGRVPT